jgi:hypothetical protein
MRFAITATIASEASLLEDTLVSPSLELLDSSTGSVTLLLLLDTSVSLSLDCGVTLLLDFAEELDAGVSPFPATTVIVPLFEAFVVAPVVVTVYLYAPGATLDATVPEM